MQMSTRVFVLKQELCLQTGKQTSCQYYDRKISHKKRDALNAQKIPQKIQPKQPNKKDAQNNRPEQYNTTKPSKETIGANQLIELKGSQ